MKNSATVDALIHAGREMHERGLTTGTSGNLSARTDQGCLITASGAACTELSPDRLVQLSPDGEHDAHQRPSSEWRFHRDIYANRDDVNAVVHAHPLFCTALACAGLEIPPFHYMVAVAGGRNIRCAPYATFGTQALSDNALAALDGRRGCLLANHGMIATGADLDAAVALAVEMENLAAQYWHALQVSEPVLLSEDEMAEALERFKSYRPAR